MTLPAYPDYAPSGTEYLGEIPSDWQTIPVKRRYEVQLGKMLQNEPASDADALVPYLKALHVLWGRVTTADLPEMWASPNEIRRFGVRGGDLLVCEGGEAGRAGMLDSAPNPCIIQNAVHRVRGTGADTRYLQYALHAIGSGGWFDVLCNRATIAHLTGGKLAELRIPLPSLPEQRAIAAFLDGETEKLDALVAEKRALTELLKEKRSALISRTVTRGLPPEAARAAGLDPHPRLKPSGVKWLGEVPAHWKVKRLSRSIECLDGRRIPLNGEERSYRQGDYPYWGANGVVDYIDGWLFDEPLVLLGEDGAPFFEPHKPVAFYVEGRIWVNNHAHVLRPLQGTNPRFLASALNCVQYGAFIDGSTRDKLTQSAMNAIPIPTPPLAEQGAIADYLDRETAKLDQMAARVEEAIERLREYRAALISAAVTGKMDVRGHVTAEAAATSAECIAGVRI